MVGDCLGAPVETWRPSKIMGVHGRLKLFVKGTHLGIDEERFAMYTDDTNSTLALAFSLVKKQMLDPEDVALENAAFFAVHEPQRGYSQHTKSTLEALHAKSVSYKDSGVMLFEEGSWSNGAPMKISPVGVAFRNSSDLTLHEAVRLSLLSTHVHPEAIDAAWVQAKAVGLLLAMNPQQFLLVDFLEKLISAAKTDNMIRNLKVIKTHLLKQLSSPQAPATATTITTTTTVTTTTVTTVNTGLMVNSTIPITNAILNSVPEIGEFFQIRAVDAVACSLYAFGKFWNQPEQAVIEAVNMGGDTDTVGAITGALVGALHGCNWIPAIWFNNLENGSYGRDFCVNLGKQLSNLDLREITYI